MAKEITQLTNQGLHNLYVHVVRCYEKDHLLNQLEQLQQAKVELIKRGLSVPVTSFKVE